MTDPRAPMHLRPATRRWWRHVVAKWTFDPADLPLLEGAAVAWDRAVEAREAIALDGAYSRNGMVRAHPAIRVEKDALLAYERLVRALNLDLAPPDNRPPSRIRGR